MQITDILNPRAIAEQYTEVASNKIPYLGESLFTPAQKMGLDLKFLKTHKGLPISLAPSNFDAKSTLRSREGFKEQETEMPFFRESMLVKEKDEQDMMRVQDSNDPYAAEILSRIFDDANTLLEGSRVVPERMIWQLLAPAVDGSPRINIGSNGVQYSYNYDPDGSYKTENYLAIATTNDKWDAVSTSDPMKDVETALDAVEAKTGTRPEIMVVSKKTMNLLKQNNKIRAYILAQNATATVMVTDQRVKDVFDSELGVKVVVYSKQYKDEDGNAHKFYPDGFATLIPSGPLGRMWKGVTPEERSAIGSNAVESVQIVDGGTAVTVTKTADPVNTKTTVSMIVLPSYERMDETFVIKAY